MDTSIARPELLLVADAVAREKSIDRDEVLARMLPFLAPKKTGETR